MAESEEHRAAIAEAGCVATIVAAMRTRPGDADVQSNACLALSHMAESEEHREAIAAAGAIAAIVAAMRAYLGDCDVQSRACRALM